MQPIQVQATMQLLTSLLTWSVNLNKEIIHNIITAQPAFPPKQHFNSANQTKISPFEDEIMGDSDMLTKFTTPTIA